MMKSGGFRAIAIAIIAVGCLAAVVLGADPLIALAIGFVGITAIDEL